MAMFGFVYLWYLMGVLVLEIWLDYRRDIVLLVRSSTGPQRGSSTGADARLEQHEPGGARVDDASGASSP